MEAADRRPVLDRVPRGLHRAPEAPRHQGQALGHALELARGAGLGVELDWPRVPLLPGVARLAADGCITGASGRNWAGYGADVTLDAGLPATARDLLTDPQTSGGLLVALDAEAAEGWVQRLRGAGYPLAAIIGRVEQGSGIAVA